MATADVADLVSDHKLSENCIRVVEKQIDETNIGSLLKRELP
jgi:hypothetical protein